MKKVDAMYIYELDALTTRSNERFRNAERHLIWLFSKDDLQERFAQTVLDKLRPMGWTDIQLKHKRYMDNDITDLRFETPTENDIKNAFQAALSLGTSWLIFEKDGKP